jgi:hypothetical protein
MYTRRNRQGKKNEQLTRVTPILSVKVQFAAVTLLCTKTGKKACFWAVIRLASVMSKVKSIQKVKIINRYLLSKHMTVVRVI